MSGVWVTGPSRSGTSLTAGLFAAHGVFFGNCTPGDEFNRKGYFEHPLLISRVERRDGTAWPSVMFDQFRLEGWNDHTPWGIKRGPKAMQHALLMRPAVVVVCRRPLDQIKESRKRWGKAAWKTRRVLKAANRKLRKIHAHTMSPIIWVNTDALVKGDFRRILPAFNVLGVEFSEDVAREWIDPGMWNQGRAL